MKTLEIVHFIDEDGTVCVKVPLSNTDKKAVLYQDDFNTLIELGVDPRWRLNTNKVILRGAARIPISRLIVDASKGEILLHRDGDPLNLRRSNLVYSAGNSEGKVRDKLAELPRRFYDNKVKLSHTGITPSWERHAAK